MASVVHFYSSSQLDEAQEKRQEKLKNLQREILQKMDEEQPLVCSSSCSFMHTRSSLSCLASCLPPTDSISHYSTGCVWSVTVRLSSSAYLRRSAATCRASLRAKACAVMPCSAKYPTTTALALAHPLTAAHPLSTHPIIIPAWTTA